MSKASISQLTVGGFQSLRDRVDIPIAPMTFLFGPNSAGKSALIDAVRLLRLLTSPRRSRETIDAVDEALKRDAHKDAASGRPHQIVLGAEVGELPAEPAVLEDREEPALSGVAYAIWKRIKGSRVQLEIELDERPSLKVLVHRHVSNET